MTLQRVLFILFHQDYETKQMKLWNLISDFQQLLSLYSTQKAEQRYISTTRKLMILDKLTYSVSVQQNHWIPSHMKDLKIHLAWLNSVFLRCIWREGSFFVICFNKELQLTSHQISFHYSSVCVYNTVLLCKAPTDGYFSC